MLSEETGELHHVRYSVAAVWWPLRSILHIGEPTNG
jgi:hypothetical protein